MRLKEQRDQAKRDAIAANELESLRTRVMTYAAIAEDQAATAMAAGDSTAMVDLLDHVVALHEAGCDEQAEALKGRIKATLAKEDADEAEAFVAEKRAAKELKDSTPKSEDEDAIEALFAGVSEEPEPPPAPKKRAKKS